MKTAYQIADELEERNAPYEDDAANFIRQQQAEIEALKANREHDLGIAEAIGFDKGYKASHPVKELNDEDIAKVVHELNQKANTPERWVTAMQIGAETIIQLRDELRKAQEK